MLVLLPAALLIFGAFVIVILQFTKRGFGYTWLTTVGFSLAAWVNILIYRWINPGVIVVPAWTAIISPGSDLDFGLTEASWMYAFSMVSLLLAVNITAPVRMRKQSSSWLWIGNLVMIAAGYLTTLAINPLTLILAWTAVDIVEMIILIGASGAEALNIRAVASFASRITGTFVVIWAIALSRSEGQVLSLGALTPQMGLYILLAVSLRLGVVPLQVHYSRIIPSRRGQNTILRLVVAASSLVVLARLPDLVMPVNWALFLSGFTALAALYGSGMWLTAKDELSGRPFFIVAMGGMAVACVVRGQTAASVAWGIALLLSGALIFLYSIHDRRYLFAPLLGMIGLIGLPFMPTAGGWAGLVVYPFSIMDIIFIFSHVALLLGYMRHAISSGGSMSGMEDWIKLIYPAGLLLLITAQWIINVTSIKNAFPPGVWWVGIISLVMTMIIFMIYIRSGREQLEQRAKGNWLIRSSISAGGAIASIFSLEWAYRIIHSLYLVLRSMTEILTSLLEGDAGILWSLLLLVLIVTLFTLGGSA